MMQSYTIQLGFHPRNTKKKVFAETDDSNFG